MRLFFLKLLIIQSALLISSHSFASCTYQFDQSMANANVSIKTAAIDALQKRGYFFDAKSSDYLFAEDGKCHTAGVSIIGPWRTRCAYVLYLKDSSGNVLNSGRGFKKYGTEMRVDSRRYKELKAVNFGQNPPRWYESPRNEEEAISKAASRFEPCDDVQ